MNSKNISTTDTLHSFLREQLSVWPLARENYSKLADARRKDFMLGNFTAEALFNPGRIISTAAKVDAASISARKCFLCGENRPPEQLEMRIPGLGHFVILVNPYPICREHFTISAVRHVPQTQPAEAMRIFAESFPGYVAFFNGAKAGASAPDHLHFQSVPASDVPILEIAEHNHIVPGVADNAQWPGEYPFAFRSFLGEEAIKYIGEIPGYDAGTGLFDPELANTFVWKDNSGNIRGISVPRKAHRPSCYFAGGDSRMLISPGALDMGGLVVMPVEDDFMKVTATRLIQVYAETGVTIGEYVRIYENF